MIIAVWLLFAFLVGYVASQKGRSGIGWFLFAVLLSPLVGIIVVAILPNRTRVA